LKPQQEARLLTTVLEPDDPRFSFNTLHDLLYEQGFTIYPGKVASANTFRIATMGAINRADIEDFLTALKVALNHMQVKMPSGFREIVTENDPEHQHGQA